MSRLWRALALAGAAALAVGPAAGQGDGPIKIATQSPLSGEQAALGEAIKLGAQLALERLKGPIERAGFAVELVPFDDQGRPHVGVANAKQIVADADVLAVVGHLNSGVALPASEVYKDADLAMLSPANTHPLLTDRGHPAVSRVCGRADRQGAVAAQFARETLKARSARVVHDGTEYGRTIAEVFRGAGTALGLTVTAFEGPEAAETVVAAIRARPPDVVFFAGEPARATALFRELRSRGITAPLVSPAGLDAAGPPGGDGPAAAVYYTAVAGSLAAYPRAQGFADDYRRAFGKEALPFAAQAYDAAAIALRAIQAAITDAGGKRPTRASVAAAVRAVKHVGLTGRVEFDERGDPKRATYLVYQAGRDSPEPRLVKRLELGPGPTSRP